MLKVWVSQNVFCNISQTTKQEKRNIKTIHLEKVDTSHNANILEHKEFNHKEFCISEFSTVVLKVCNAFYVADTNFWLYIENCQLHSSDYKWKVFSI